MATATKRRATYEDYLALPEHVVGEIVAGELHVSPRPAPPHANAQSSIRGKLDRFHHGGPAGWWILMEPEIQLVPREVVSPDMAGWRRERMPKLPATAYFKLAPDWLCEVLSPSNNAWDRTVKLPLYARHGIPYVWLVDPIGRSLEVFALDPDGLYKLAMTARESDHVHAPPFEELELALDSLWAERDEPDPEPAQP